MPTANSSRCELKLAYRGRFRLGVLYLLVSCKLAKENKTYLLVVVWDNLPDVPYSTPPDDEKAKHAELMKDCAEALTNAPTLVITSRQ